MSALTPARPFHPFESCWFCRTPLQFIGRAARYVAGLGMECANCGDQLDAPLDDIGRAIYKSFQTRVAAERAVKAVAS